MLMYALSVGVDPASFKKLLTRKQLERATTILKLALVVLMLFLLAYTLAQSIEGIFNTRTLISDLDKQIALEKAKLEQVSTGAGKKDLSKISDSSIFGRLKTNNPNIQKSEAAKPKSTIPLNLIGTFVSDDSAAYAIIEDKKKNLQEVFNINESIFGEAELIKIHADHVEIKRGDKIELLLLDDSAITSAKSSGGIVEAGENEFVVDETELNTALDDLPLLLTQARAVPYFRDGRAIGLRMFAIKSDSLYQKIGLKNGDILKTVNDSSLANIQEAMKLFERLKEERSIVVELERNKQNLNFRYSIR
ncbi:MAG: type II secretion system protein N [Bdellovibrionota bacterium]